MSTKPSAGPLPAGMTSLPPDEAPGADPRELWLRVDRWSHWEPAEWVAGEFVRAPARHPWLLLSGVAEGPDGPFGLVYGCSASDPGAVLERTGLRLGEMAAAGVNLTGRDGVFVVGANYGLETEQVRDALADLLPPRPAR